MTSAMTTVARTTATASLRIVHRARGRYRPLSVRTATQVAAYSRRNASGWGTICAPPVDPVGAESPAREQHQQEPDGDQAVDGDQQGAEPEGVASNHAGASMRGWCVQAMVPMGRRRTWASSPGVRGRIRRALDCPGMPARSLSIVLPAYNEEERLGPALDELFGYLHRRGGRGARGPARPGRAPRDDPGPRRRRRQHRRHRRPRPCPARGGGRRARAPDRAARRQGRGGPRRAWSRPSGEVVIFTDADMATPPDEIPLLVEALETADAAYGSRIQPDGSRHARVAAGVAAGAGQDVPRARVAVGRRARSRTRSAGSRASGATSRATCSRASRSPASCSTSR